MSWKKTYKNIVDRTNTNTSDSTRDSCIVHNNHMIKKDCLKKKTLVMVRVPALACNISCSKNKLDTTGIHFGTIKMS